MKVALYYPWVYLPGGPERVIYELTGRSRHDWTVFTNHYARDQTFSELAERDIRELRPVSVERSVWKAASAAFRILTQKIPLDDFQALIVLGEGLGDLVTLRNGRLPTLCICLTPLRPAFDPHYRKRAFESRGAAGRLALRAGLAIFEAVDRVAWKKYSRVFCVSEEVRKRILAASLAPAERLEVLHPSVGVSADSDRETSYQRFFLIPGRIMWTKNIELGIEAFRRFRRLRSDFRLLIAGVVDQKSKSYLARLRRLAAGEPGIEFRISPSDEELEELYRTCYAVLFTAFNEDWGIVPLEAMASAKAVIATNRGGPTESIVHGQQGFLENPDPDVFSARMEELASDPSLARTLGAAGRERSRLFSWDVYARRIDEELDALVDSERSAPAPSAPVEVDAR